MNNAQTFDLPSFNDLHILVVGDVMIDRYIHGKVRRISPEAPVPVVEMEHTKDNLGGAANVAVNISALGARVTLVSVIGSDDGGEALRKMTKNYPQMDERLLSVQNRKTTVKTRIMSSSQHLLRIDKEDTDDIANEDAKTILNVIQNTGNNSKIDAIIMQDYNKGLLTKELIQAIISYSIENNIPTFVDPKEKNFFAYTGCTLFKPNQKEVRQAVGESTKDYHKIDQELRQKLGHSITLITLGSGGVYINNGVHEILEATEPRIIADVCGAGDSVISAVCLSYLKGMSIRELAMIANAAGGQVCEQPGVASVDLFKLKKELNQ